MTVIDRIAAFVDDLAAMRQDFHAHPELGFEEVRTSGIVAEALASWGMEVHRGLGQTGIIGVLRGARGEGPTIGLRADMDALPIEERTNLPYASRNPGVMHACGHDGHTTMLLGAARYLAETRDFAGTAVFIFQPAEEGLGGARSMLADGLFERFPCDEVYGLHNSPALPKGQVAVWPGPAMAGADFFDVTIEGRGAHAAMPQLANDPVVVASILIQAFQTIVSRNASPLKAAVLSITRVQAGSAYNVIPEEAVLSGTIRAFDDDLRALVGTRMREIASGVATAYGVEISCDIRDIFTVLENNEQAANHVATVAREVVGPEKLSTLPNPLMGSEDFADMLRTRPGAYFFLGQANDVALHNPGFLFDDDILPVGASMLARIIEARAA